MQKSVLQIYIEEIELARQLNDLIIGIKRNDDFIIQDIFYEIKSYSYITSESLSRHSQRIIADTRNQEKRNLARPRRRGEEESENISESSSHITKKVIVNTKNKENKYSASRIQTSGISGKNQEQKYFSKKIEITPIKDDNKKQGYVSSIQTQYKNQGNKYFTKNIVIQPVNTSSQKDESYNKRGFGRISNENKNLNNTADILKGIKYFNKNIVIEPVHIEKYTTQNVSMKDSGNKYHKQIGESTAYTRGTERRPWQIDAKSGELFSRKISSNTQISEDILKNIPGIDENTKFYHKEITITPVTILPLKFNQK